MTREDSLHLELLAEKHNHQKDNEDFMLEIERLKAENDKMAYQLEKIAGFTVHPYSAARAVLKELGRWTEEPKP